MGTITTFSSRNICFLKKKKTQLVHKSTSTNHSRKRFEWMQSPSSEQAGVPPSWLSTVATTHGRHHRTKICHCGSNVRRNPRTTLGTVAFSLTFGEELEVGGCQRANEAGRGAGGGGGVNRLGNTQDRNLPKQNSPNVSWVEFNGRWNLLSYSLLYIRFAFITRFLWSYNNVLMSQVLLEHYETYVL